MMKYIQRHIQNDIIESLTPNRVIMLLGARRTGKTELVKNISESRDENQLFLNGEDIAVQDMFQPMTIENYRMTFSDTELLIIDEAQKIPEVGKKLKLLVDNIDGIKVLVTGSSAFDVEYHMGEPLTGRKKTFYLYPFSQLEYTHVENILETKSRLPLRLIYGSYPELYHLENKKQKEAYLYEITKSYLFKDILELDGIKNADKIRNLLRLIAFQIGHEVSLHELAQNLEMHKETIARYLDLLSKVFVIYKVEGFSRNLRSEISKKSRWYFFDNGIRNVLINNLNDLEIRDDHGQLWENYLISERIKYQSYRQIYASNYFWRTYQQQEIDWIEERGGRLYAYEIKWNPKKKVKEPAAFRQAYPKSDFHVITPENYLQWIGK